MPYFREREPQSWSQNERPMIDFILGVLCPLVVGGVIVGPIWVVVKLYNYIRKVK